VGLVIGNGRLMPQKGARIRRMAGPGTFSLRKSVKELEEEKALPQQGRSSGRCLKATVTEIFALGVEICGWFTEGPMRPWDQLSWLASPLLQGAMTQAVWLHGRLPSPAPLFG